MTTRLHLENEIKKSRIVSRFVVPLVRTQFVSGQLARTRIGLVYYYLYDPGAGKPTRNSCCTTMKTIASVGFHGMEKTLGNYSRSLLLTIYEKVWTIKL